MNKHTKFNYSFKTHSSFEWYTI